jgi:hypothetical protein
MANRGNGGALTAWKGSTGIITDEVNTYGVYQANGRIVRAEDAPEDLNLSERSAVRQTKQFLVKLMASASQLVLVRSEDPGTTPPEQSI